MRQAFKIFFTTALLAASPHAVGGSGSYDSVDLDNYPWLNQQIQAVIEKAIISSMPEDKNIRYLHFGLSVRGQKDEPTSIFEASDPDRKINVVSFPVEITKVNTNQNKPTKTSIVWMDCDVETFVKRADEGADKIEGIYARLRNCESNKIGLITNSQEWQVGSPVAGDVLIGKVKGSIERANSCEEVRNSTISLGGLFASTKSEKAKEEIKTIIRDLTRDGICFGQIYENYTLTQNLGTGPLMALMENEWESLNLRRVYGPLDFHSIIGSKKLRDRNKARSSTVAPEENVKNTVDSADNTESTVSN